MDLEPLLITTNITAFYHPRKAIPWREAENQCRISTRYQLSYSVSKAKPYRRKVLGNTVGDNTRYWCLSPQTNLCNKRSECFDIFLVIIPCAWFSLHQLKIDTLPFSHILHPFLHKFKYSNSSSRVDSESGRRTYHNGNNRAGIIPMSDMWF